MEKNWIPNKFTKQSPSRCIYRPKYISSAIGFIVDYFVIIDIIIKDYIFLNICQISGEKKMTNNSFSEITNSKLALVWPKLVTM